MSFGFISGATTAPTFVRRDPTTDPTATTRPGASTSSASTQVDQALQAQIEAAKQAQRELEKAIQTQRTNQDKTKNQQLQADVDAKRKLAADRWAALKADIKAQLQSTAPADRDKLVGNLKSSGGNDSQFNQLVDAALKEPPDIKIVTTGNAEADAAAMRVAGAYAEGGDAKAAQQLRTELEAAKTPEQRQALMRAAMPVVDQVSRDLGMNSRRGTEDWGKDGSEAGGSYSTDLDNTNPIDTASEYDDTLKNLSASVELGADPKVAVHVAQQLLQLMPGSNAGNSKDNLLGLLGNTLPQGTSGKPPLLTSAVATVLVQPGQGAPAGSELALDIGQRTRAAKMLDPTLLPSVVVEDWTDASGVSHDGTVWHEVSQNPDLFLTDEQRAEIEARTKGWTPDQVNIEKTAQAVNNLRGQYRGVDLDEVNDGDQFTFVDPDATAPQPLTGDLKTAVDTAKTAHAGDTRFALDLDTFVTRPEFQRLSAADQVKAVKAYERTITQANKSGKPLSAEQETKLQQLITSPGYHSVNDRVKDRVLGMFVEFANSAPDKLDRLQRLVNDAGFTALDDEGKEFQVLEGYQHDAVFAATVDKLVDRKDLNSEEQKMALDLLRQVQHDRQLYGKGDADERRKIMDSTYELVTSPRFRAFTQKQREAAINYLVKYGDEEYALENNGVNKALDKAAKLKDPGPANPTTGAQPTTQPTTAPGGQPPAAFTPDKLKGDLNTTMQGAGDMANSDATINDPLRRVAEDDPFTFAYLKLTQQHQNDKPYLDALKQALPELRRDYTQRRVKELVDQGKHGEALKLLKTNMDATADPTERTTLWEAAGKPVFTTAYYEKRINDIVGDKGNIVELQKQLGQLFKEVGENAPPEASNVLLDTLKPHLEKGRDDPLTQALLSDMSLKGEAFSGLSVLVDGAAALGLDRSDEFAGLLFKEIEKSAADRSLDPGLTLVLMTGNGGVFTGIKDAVGNHGAVRLSAALHDKFASQNGGKPVDWAARAQGHTRSSIRMGIDELKRHVGDAAKAWQESNETALRFVQDFGSVDPEKVQQAILDDRVKNPIDANKVDDAQIAMDQQGLKIDRLLRGLTTIDINFDTTQDPGEKALARTIKQLDEDPASMSTLQNNVLLQQDVTTKLNFGQFDGNENPLNPAAIVGAQQDYVEKVIADYHLPDDVAKSLRERTDRWAKDMKAEVAKGDKMSEDTLRSLTDTYRKDVEKILDGRLPPGANVLVHPTDTVIAKIRTGWQTTGTVTSTLRLTKNFYTVTGETVLNTYAIVAFKRGSANPKVWSPGSTVVGNAARLLNADKTLVDDTVKYLEKFQQKAQALADPKTGLLSAADQKALELEFKKGLPDYGSGVDTSDVNHPKHIAARFFRLLGAACFVGSSINNAINASNEPGRTSSDLFALFFGAGAATDFYRGLRGVQFKDTGKLVDFIKDNTKFGAYLERTAGPGAVGNLVKTFKDGGVGSLLTVADMMWAYEDFAGEPIWASDKSNPGDWRAGALTTGIVAGDLIDLGAMALRTQVGRTALTGALSLLGADALAVGAQAWIPVVGWIGAGVTAVFLGARFAYGVSDAKNKFEYGDSDHQRYVEMVRQLGFSDPQLKQLLNNNGGSSFWKIDSFFTEGGVSPMHVLNAMFDHNNVPQQQRLQYLQSLSDGDISKLVKETHSILDNDMGDDGTIDAADCEKIEAWMRDNGLWKTSYLGA